MLLITLFRHVSAEYPRIFRTGDYAKIVKGSVIYEGRVDSQIKIRGHRVDLTEVERTIARIPDLDKVVVLCYKPGELSQVNSLRRFPLSTQRGFTESSDVRSRVVRATRSVEIIIITGTGNF